MDFKNLDDELLVLALQANKKPMETVIFGLLELNLKVWNEYLRRNPIPPENDKYGRILIKILDASAEIQEFYEKHKMEINE